MEEFLRQKLGEKITESVSENDEIRHIVNAFGGSTDIATGIVIGRSTTRFTTRQDGS